MSTPFAANGSTDRAAPERSAAPGISAESAGVVSAETLALAAGAFAGTFERWANRKAIEAGASIPRLRLLYSVHCNGPQKMADLAGQLDVTPRNVTALVDGLEAEGFVRRIAHSTDRRVTLVELTCDSDRVAEQFAAYQASTARLFEGLDDADGRTLLRLLELMRERMHADGPCPTAQGETDA